MKNKKKTWTLVRHNYIKYWNLKSGQLHSQESREWNWIFNIGEILKINIAMDVTTQTIKKAIQT